MSIDLAPSPSSSWLSDVGHVSLLSGPRFFSFLFGPLGSCLRSLPRGARLLVKFSVNSYCSCVRDRARDVESYISGSLEFQKQMEAAGSSRVSPRWGVVADQAAFIWTLRAAM